MSLHLLSNTLWGAGVALQSVLIALLFRCGPARRMPFFTTLFVFFVVRSVLLYSVVHVISSAAYINLSTALSVLDFLLELTVAAELLYFVPRSSGARSSSLTGPLILLVASALTMLVTSSLPPHSLVPADRATVFTGIVFALLLVWRVARHAAWSTEMLALAGLAITGVAGVVGQAARSITSFRHDPRAYTAWSYANSALYMAVLLWWILRLSRFAGATQSEERFRANPSVTTD